MQHMLRTVAKPIKTSITIPGSKSMTNRALILAALADGVSEITGMDVSPDTKTFINALHQLGIVAQLDESSRSCIIAGCNGQFPKKQATIWCGDAKVATRLLITACASTPGIYYFDGGATIHDLPIDALLQILCRQGAQLIPSDIQKIPFTLVGADSLDGGEVNFDDAASSQLFSALLLIAPYARSAFNFTGFNVNHQHYVEMTCGMMAEFGVLVHRIHQGQFMVPVPQRYQARDYAIEPDYTLAAYFFAAAALTAGEITILNIKRAESKQINVKCLALFEKMGCTVLESENGLTLKGPTELHGIDVTMQDFSDNFLALVTIAPFANSPTRIMHSEDISKKELKLLHSIKIEFQKMGIPVETGPNWIKIDPCKPKHALLDAHMDHRMAMAFALMGLRIPNLYIENASCTIDRYTEFSSLWDTLTQQPA